MNFLRARRCHRDGVFGVQLALSSIVEQPKDGTGDDGEDVPGFGLAVGKPDRVRERIIRMHLNR